MRGEEFRISAIVVDDRREGEWEVIFASCIRCDKGFTVYLDERYLDALKENKVTYTRHVCECGQVNFVEHRRILGQTISEEEFIKRGGYKEPHAQD